MCREYQAMVDSHRGAVDAVRLFNRFYTRRIGVLGEGHLDSPYTLTEVRVLYELARSDRPRTAAELQRGLGLDAGYLSRVLERFHRSGLVRRSPSPDDRRRTLVELTKRGRAVFARLDEKASDAIAELLTPFSEEDRRALVGALGAIRGLLGDEPERGPKAFVLRPHQAGDLGWIVQRHGALYAQEYGWNQEFEALVAEIAASFLKNFDPDFERCWIAEREGERVGSVMVVKQSKTVAKLRLLLVEPRARGAGLGRQLVNECIRFSRQAGYRALTLWTNDVLSDARRIYEAAGFMRVAREPHRSFGKKLVSETWELDLRSAC